MELVFARRWDGCSWLEDRGCLLAWSGRVRGRVEGGGSIDCAFRQP